MAKGSSKVERAGSWFGRVITRTPGTIMVLMAVLILFGTWLLRPKDSGATALVLDQAAAKIRRIDDSFFVTNGMDLLENGVAEVENFSGAIPASDDVLAVGYADERHSSYGNDRLAKGRAEAVTKVLSKRHPAARAVGLGATHATKCRDRPEAERDKCWAADRRVEIWNKPAADTVDAAH